MTDFDQKTLRLKLALGVTQDQEVAKPLGLSGRAWCGRKRRDAFPVADLWALSAQRPELRLDVAYVLTGERSAHPAPNVPPLTTKEAGAILNFMTGADEMPDYTNEPQQRILRMVLLLAGNEITGLTPTDIAKQQSCSPSVVTRDLDNLSTLGLAEKVPETGRWRLGPQIVQIAMKHHTAMDRADRRVAEVRQRFSRQP